MQTARAQHPVIGLSCTKQQTPSVCAIKEQIALSQATLSCFTHYDKSRVAEDIAAIDALIVMGNDFDIDPHDYIHRYDEGDGKRCVHHATKSERACPDASARGHYENAMIKAALAMKIPLFGICGGMQRINVLCGGTLHQHIPDLTKTDMHEQRALGYEPTKPLIPMLILQGTKLDDIASSISVPFLRCDGPATNKVITENSLHHQAIDKLGYGLIVCSICDAFPREDGTCDYMVKAIESDPRGPYADQFILGVQWHPEFGASEIGSLIIKRVIQEAWSFANLA
ncbi:MAG: gamma-glutamyl-gamma-aminobutyrate hydrolase family protein [Rickettsiales bacterium]|nr:gamma-glutamyl-gamma-aminobutyrate hydrolase family protein [Rickettsiales bacterium]